MPFENVSRRAARHARTERLAEVIAALLFAGAAAACTGWLL